MAMQRRYLARDEDRITFYEGMGACAEPGPYSSVCTEAFPNHEGDHADAQTGETWANGWEQTIPEGDVP